MRDVDAALSARDAALEAAAAKLTEACAAIELRDAEAAEQGGILRAALLRAEELERVATTLSERVVERESELHRIRAELAEAGARGDEEARALASIAVELDAVRGQARGQATRIRMRALQDATELSDRLAELAGLPAGVRDGLLESIFEALGRIVSAGGAQAAVVAADPEPAATGLYDGMVEVEVGPLDDFAQLVGFEDAAKGIDATTEISVTRFTQGRATLEMHLSEPVELLRELEERAPFEFRVRDTRSDRVVLDIDAE